MTVQCCVCKRIREGGQWLEWADNSFPERNVSHTYCPLCAAGMFSTIQTEIRREGVFCPCETPLELILGGNQRATVTATL